MGLQPARPNLHTPSLCFLALFPAATAWLLLLPLLDLGLEVMVLRLASRFPSAALSLARCAASLARRGSSLPSWPRGWLVIGGLARPALVGPTTGGARRTGPARVRWPLWSQRLRGGARATDASFVVAGGVLDTLGCVPVADGGLRGHSWRCLAAALSGG